MRCVAMRVPLRSLPALLARGPRLCRCRRSCTRVVFFRTCCLARRACRACVGCLLPRWMLCAAFSCVFGEARFSRTCCSLPWPLFWVLRVRPTTVRRMRISMRGHAQPRPRAPARRVCSGALGQAAAWRPSRRPRRHGLSALVCGLCQPRTVSASWAACCARRTSWISGLTHPSWLRSR